MTEGLLPLIEADLPLLVREIESADPFVSIVGDGWYLALNCPWTLVTPARSYGWDDGELEDRAWDLIGHQITGVSHPDPDSADIDFQLSGGYAVQVRPDTDLDPWVMRLPHHLVVGTMSSR